MEAITDLLRYGIVYNRDRLSTVFYNRIHPVE